jgi:hypothetical protein
VSYIASPGPYAAPALSKKVGSTILRLLVSARHLRTVPPLRLQAVMARGALSVVFDQARDAEITGPARAFERPTLTQC